MNKIIPVSKPEITLTDAKSVFKVVKNGWVSSSGQEIEKFEKKFALLFKRKFAITVSNGTAALEIALKTLNLKTNSEVLIPNFNIISANVTLTLEAGKNFFLKGPITIASGVTYTVSGSGTLEII